MERRDFVLREIELLGRLARRVLELLGIRRVAEARAEVERAAREAGAELALINALADDSLMTVLSLRGGADPDRALIFAELLRLQALIARAEGNPRLAATSARRSLMLVEHVEALRRAGTRTRASEETIRQLADELHLLLAEPEAAKPADA